MIKIADKDRKTKKSKAFCREFIFVDMPFHLIRDFISDVKEKYGDIYWVKLQDLLRKAEAYDALMLDVELEKVEQEQMKKEEEEKDKPEKVMTFAGEVKNDQGGDEK